MLQSLKKVMITTVKPVLSGHSRRTPKIGFQYQLLLNEGLKYCRMRIKLPSVFKTFVLSIFECPLKTGFTILPKASSPLLDQWTFPIKSDTVVRMVHCIY